MSRENLDHEAVHSSPAGGNRLQDPRAVFLLAQQLCFTSSTDSTTRTPPAGPYSTRGSAAKANRPTCSSRRRSGEIPELITGDSHEDIEGIKRTVSCFLATMYGMHRETRNVVRAVEEGRLANRGNGWEVQIPGRVTERNRGNPARLKKALNVSSGALHRVLLDVARATKRVAAVGDRITITSQTMAEGAISRARSARETAGSPPRTP
jgi:hypothetical protein